MVGEGGLSGRLAQALGYLKAMWGAGVGFSVRWDGPTNDRDDVMNDAGGMLGPGENSE